MHKNLLILLLFFLKALTTVFSQNNIYSAKLNWLPVSSVRLPDDRSIPVLSFSGAAYEFDDGFLPRYNYSFILSGNYSNFNTTITNPVYKILSDTETVVIQNIANISNQITIKTTVVYIEKQAKGIVSFVPIRKNSTSGKYEKLISFDLVNTPSGQSSIQSRSARIYASNSVLNSGSWYKIAIANDGIYKLTYSFFQSLGIDVNSVDPRNIRIYGNGGGMLPELNSVTRNDDLVENAILVQGENDGVFNAGDYVLFYGKGQNKWQYDGNSCSKYNHSINLYADSAYYFITADLGSGKRIQPQGTSLLTPTHIVNSFDDYAFHESENVNFLKSGKHWFGEYFENNSSASFSFVFPNIDNGAKASVKLKLASRCTSSAASYFVSSQSGSGNVAVPAVTSDPYLSNYAEIDSVCYTFYPNNPSLTVNFVKQTAGALAWIDFVEVNVRRNLVMYGHQMEFRDAQSVGYGNIAQFNLTSNATVQIWDITDIHDIKNQSIVVNGSNKQFATYTNSLRQFIAFTGGYFYTPRACGLVPNQNLHSLSNKNLIIVTHPNFYQEALQLAAHHQNHDGLSSAVVTTQEVYNEFSSGAQDVSAIRDFVKMFYDKAATPSELPKYLLLFGDGSYDNKNRLSNNTNFIPTYQSENSIFETSTYVSDDFYGLLDDNEGLWNNDVVDIGIGRLPVASRGDAQITVNKILSYTKSGIASTENTTNSDSPYGNWRNTICYIADDGDSDLHISQADQEATYVDTTYNNYNIDKIYLDAYRQETTPGGNKYPDVNKAIDDRVAQGALIINWTGHGKEGGLAHEGIVSIYSIGEWSNASKLFLFITASCEISRYDNPAYKSAGEYAFLNSKGAAIALLSTVRVVYASPNFQLNLDLYKSAFQPVNGTMPRLGDIYKFAKNQPGGNSVNSRNFALIGDPALMLAYPQLNVATDSINHTLVTTSSSDTLKALSLVTISGHVTDKNGNGINNFDGVIYPTVYDKASSITTLSNKGTALSPPFTFKLQKNILFNGKASVRNGYFKFMFVVPKDIAYQYGIGRISYYAENGSQDAAGYNEQIVVGGYDNSAPPDNAGPDVHLYMNNNKFVFGGLTNENPNLYAVLFDENGINIIGNSIGHDLVAVLDDNTSNPVNLNQYYKSDLNTYKSGTVTYPFKNLSEGKHTLKMRAWDVYNNPSDANTEFVVAKSSKVALNHVLNYPNPFTTKTQFFFEHNQANMYFEVQIQIFTITGKLIKTIAQFVNSDGYRSDPIEWDGRDDFGDKIGRGVYMYRVKIKSNDNGVAEKYEKLVILN